MEYIPKNIAMQCKTKELLPRYRDLARSWEYYFSPSEYTHIIHDDIENLELVTRYYPQYLDFYNTIEKGIERSDFARYLWLHFEGGIYHDTDYEARVNFYDYVKDYDFTVVESKIPLDEGTQNSLMSSRKGCDFWLKVCDKISVTYHVNRVGRHKDSVVKTTGPAILSKCVREYGKDYKYRLLPHRKFLINPGIYATHHHFGSWLGRVNEKNENIEYKCSYNRVKRNLERQTSGETDEGWKVILIGLIVLLILAFATTKVSQK